MVSILPRSNCLTLFSLYTTFILFAEALSRGLNALEDNPNFLGVVW